MAIAAAAEEVLKTALEGDPKSRAFVMQILSFKMKSYLMHHMHGGRKGPKGGMGGAFGGMGGPHGGIGNMFGGMGGPQDGMKGSQGGMSGMFGGMGGPQSGMGGMGDMFGGMGGSQDGMSGMFGGMGSSQGGMNGMFGGMGGPQGGMGGMGDMFGGMGGSQGGMSGMFGGMGGPQGGMSTSAVRRGPEGSGGNVRPTDGAGSSRPPNFDNSRPPQNTTPFESGDRRTSLPPMTSNSVTNNIGNNAVFSASSIGPQSWGEQSDGSFICKDGTRIDLIKIKCDGFTDCRDKSDEANCTRRFRRDASIEDVNSVEDHNSTEDRNSTEDHNSVEETNSWENDNDDRAFGNSIYRSRLSKDRSGDRRRRNGTDTDSSNERSSSGNRRERGSRKSSPGRFDDDDLDSGEDILDALTRLIGSAGDDNETAAAQDDFLTLFQDIMRTNVASMPGFNNNIHNSVQQNEKRNGTRRTMQLKRSSQSSMFPRPGRHGGGRGGGRNFHCSAKMKEMLEMKKVISMMFMQLVNSEPDNMKGFTFLPVTLRQSLKSAITMVLMQGPPRVNKPWFKALQNNSRLSNLTFGVYKDAKKLKGVDKLQKIFDYWRNNASQLARNALAGDSESLELLDLSLQYMDASKPYLARMHDIKSRMMEMMKNDRTKMRSLLSGKLGTEPTLDERCMRLSGDVAQAMNSAQITQQEVSTIFESPFDMMQEDGNSESSSSSVPIYWRVENQDVLRGERCFATGAMTWSKVAVCSCKESAVRLPPVMFGPQPFGMNGRGGSDEDMGVGNEIFGMGGGRPGGGFRGIGGGEGPSRGGFFGRGGSRDGDQNGDDDNDNSGGSGMMFPNLPGPSNSGGSPIIFPGSSIDLSTIQNIISNSISNPDGSLNLDALKNIFANQASGGLDLGSIFGNVGSQISPNMTPQATSNTGGSAGGSGGFDINSLQSFFNSNGPRTGGPMSNFNFAPLRSGNNRPDANRQINLGAENRNRSDAGRPDANRQINLGAGNRNRSDAGRPFDRDAGWHNSTNNSSRLSHIELNHRSEMELQDGTLQVTGEVLVGLKLNGSFDLGSICADSWNSTEALVVCNVLANRLSRHEKPLMRAQAKSPVKPPKTPMNNELNVAIKLGGVKCQGNETDIMQCTHSPWGPQSCPGNVKATVTCIVR
ncbi:uncharacterized protein LOC108676475 [Hyalella azteca]|uniref:Uncharacterized protein LOC108676475 n=1 Tax=Hyalella azteca TaxID=294128 RepID=A0A8B7P4P6_HYAAZ|nr:uncharacterized protein LOC108676475 [Hyalella azteca]